MYSFFLYPFSLSPSLSIYLSICLPTYPMLSPVQNKSYLHKIEVEGSYYSICNTQLYKYSSKSFIQLNNRRNFELNIEVKLKGTPGNSSLSLYPIYLSSVGRQIERERKREREIWNYSTLDKSRTLQKREERHPRLLLTAWFHFLILWQCCKDSFRLSGLFLMFSGLTSFSRELAYPYLSQIEVLINCIVIGQGYIYI